MIKFIIDKIQLRNVRNYGDEIMEMDFPLDNLTVFTGHVGAGKSTILKSVSMALYGDDGGVKGEKLSIDDMVNERSGKNLEIHLFFRAIDTLNNDHTDNYEIHLYHKHSKMNNKLVFMKNGVDISANGKMDTYRLIEKTTIPKDVYHNIYYFTQQAKNFFTALPNSEQKAIFDSILDLSDYDKYYQNCRQNITEYEQKLSECELKLKMIESNISEKTGMIETEKVNIENATKKNEEELVELKKEIDIIDSKLKKYNDDSVLKMSSKELTENISKIESDSKIEINNLNNEIKNLESQIDTIKDKYQKLFTDEKSKAKDELDKLNNPIKEEIQKLELKQNDLSHQQTKEISEEKSKCDNEESKLESECKEKKSGLNQSLKDLERDLLDYQAKVKSDYLSKQNETNEEINKVKDAIKDIELKLNECKSGKNELSSKLDELHKIYEANKKQLESDTPICDKCGQPLVNLDRLKKEQSVIEKKTDEINQKINELSNNEKLIHDSIVKQTNWCDSLKKQLQEYKEELTSEYNVKKVEIEEKMKEINKSLETINELYKNKISEISNHCDIKCSDIENKYKKIFEEVKQSIEDNRNKIEFNTNEARNKLITLSQEFNKKISEASSDIKKKIEDKTSEVSKLNSNLISRIGDLKKQLSDIEIEEQNIETLNVQLNQKKSEFKVKEEFKVSDDALKSLEKSIEDDKTKLKDCESSKKDLSKTLEILEFWKTAFSDSGIKSMLIDVAIPHMNQCVREELDRVCPGIFTVSFDTLSETKSGNIRDKFSINIVHNIKCATGHKKLSGGEKRIIDFCCMSALRSLAEKLYGKMFSHIFYDEVLDSLDSESRELFCRSMKNQSSDHRNITLVTHALTEDVDPDRVFPF